MVKYVYSSKAKKVLAVEPGSALEKQAIARGLQLFDSLEEAELAVQQASAPASEPEGYVIDKAGKVKRIAGELYGKAVARGVVIYDDLETARAATAPAGGSSDAKEPERSSQPISGLRESALAYLDRLYEGDLGRDLGRIAAGEKMAEGTTDAQKRFITMARAVSAARTDDEVREAMASVPEIAARRELDFKQKNWHRGGEDGPPGKAIIAPNLTYRTQRGSGAVSKGLGVAEDLFSLVPRVLRAGAEELTSSADDMTFAERMAVPHELLSAPQAMFTEGLSSIAPGIATERAGVAIGNAVANVLPYANRARALLHGKQGLIAESVTDAVRNLDLPEKISRGAYAGRQAIKGLGEGAAYSAHPVALELTSPDEGSTARAALTGAMGLGSGVAARAGLGALTYGSKVRSLSPEILTPAGREMRYGNGPMERIGAAISADERLLDRHGVPKALSRGSESQLAPLDQAVGDIYSARTALEDRAAEIFLKYGDRLPEEFKDQQLTPDMAHRLGYDIEKFGLPEELLAKAKRPAVEYRANVKPGELPEEAFAFPGVTNQYPKAEALNPRIFPEPVVSLEHPAPLTELKFPEPIAGERAIDPRTSTEGWPAGNTAAERLANYRLQRGAGGYLPSTNNGEFIGNVEDAVTQLPEGNPPGTIMKPHRAWDAKETDPAVFYPDRHWAIVPPRLLPKELPPPTTYEKTQLMADLAYADGPSPHTEQWRHRRDENVAGALGDWKQMQEYSDLYLEAVRVGDQKYAANEAAARAALKKAKPGSPQAKKAQGKLDDALARRGLFGGEYGLDHPSIFPAMDGTPVKAYLRHPSVVKQIEMPSDRPEYGQAVFPEQEPPELVQRLEETSRRVDEFKETFRSKEQKFEEKHPYPDSDDIDEEEGWWEAREAAIEGDPEWKKAKELSDEADHERRAAQKSLDSAMAIPRYIQWPDQLVDIPLEGPPQLLEFPVAGPPRQVSVPVEGPPMIPFGQDVRYWAPSRKSAAETVASWGFNQENAKDYLKVAQPLTHYGVPHVQLPSDEFSRVSAMLQELPRSGKEEEYLRNIGRSRLERSTNIEPFRNAANLRSRVNRELGTEFNWDIPAVVAAYRQRLTPGAALDLNSVDLNAVLPFSAAATLAGGKEAARMAGSAGRGVVAYSPAAGARQETRYGKASANVPTLKIIGKGGIVEDPFVVKKKWKSVDDMD